MPTLEQPTNDPDGLHLMASLRSRLRRGGTPAPAASSEQYRPAMAAVQALLMRRTVLCASSVELDKLQAIASTLQTLAAEAG